MIIPLPVMTSFPAFFSRPFVVLMLICVCRQAIRAQDYRGASLLYNGLIGAVTGGVGSVINKHKGQKWYTAFAKGFAVGAGGGMIMYGGKRINSLISVKSELGYGYLSRFVFDMGNSIVENAAANRNFWEVVHYDVGFIRLELETSKLRFRPRVMASTFIGTVFLATQGRFDARTSLASGTPTFRTKSISYAPKLNGSTLTNGFLLNDTLRGNLFFYDIYAHEMIHTFQFRELAGINQFFNPLKTKWKERSGWYAKLSPWIYGDLNYELYGINYFFINGGPEGKHYCRNFLENEAEYLSTERSACDFKAH